MSEETQDDVGRTTFTDAKGTEWDITLTLVGAKRIDASDFSEVTDKPFSFLKPDKKLFSEVLTETPVMFAIIWAIVQPQVKDKIGIDPTENPIDAEAEFLERIHGDAIQQGKDAFWGCVANFFPDQRTALLTLQKQYRSAQNKINLALGDLQADMDKVVDSEVDKEVKKMRKELTNLTTSND